MYVVDVDCPVCKERISLSMQQIRRGMVIDCPLCAGRLVASGRFLSEIFWAANNTRREAIL